MAIMPRQPSPAHIAELHCSGEPEKCGRQRIFLLPGNLHVSVEPCQITTILGSCVSICLWDKKRRLGGMNHFLLPAARSETCNSSRFADVATSALLQHLQSAGCQRCDLVSKIFGGAAILRNETLYPTSLGANNVVAALRLMESAAIPVVAAETGGDRGRKIVFHTDDGEVWSRTV